MGIFRKKTKYTSLFIVLLMITFILSSCGQKTVEQPKDVPQNDTQDVRKEFKIQMAGGPEGAITNALYSMMFEDFRKELPYLQGSPTNSAPAASVVGLVEGKYNIAQSFRDLTGSAIDGLGFFEDTGALSGFCNLVTLWPMTTTWIVWADSPYNSLEDLKGKNISPGPRGGANHLELLNIIKEKGLSESDFKIQLLGFDDAQQQMLDGHLDALLYTFTAYPHGGLLNVMAQKQVRFLPVDEETRDVIVNKYKGIRKSVLPAGVYNLKDGTVNPEVPGIGGNVHLIVMKDFPEDIAYDMVKVITENFERYQSNMVNLKGMDVKDLAQEIPGVEMHPGAIKYFKERGFIE